MDSNLDLIASALECVDEALEPHRFVLPWTIPHLIRAQKALEAALRAENGVFDEIAMESPTEYRRPGLFVRVFQFFKILTKK